MDRELIFRIWNGKTMEEFVLDNDFDCICGWLDNSFLLQFTGHISTNKKRIYEGDIVRKSVFPCGESSPIGQVAFALNKFNCEFVIRGDNKNDWYDYDGNQFHWDELEVIGNIYETPELLR
jgi:uncharacterized phage protein (TIGR01671 family)